jgi:hypothetical protein
MDGSISHHDTSYGLTVAAVVYHRALEFVAGHALRAMQEADSYAVGL